MKSLLFKVLWGALALLCLAATFNHFSPQIPFVVTTDSIPRGIYWAQKTNGDSSWQKGQLGCFPYKAPQWAEARNYLSKTRLICKQVAGLPTDKVHLDAQAEISVCNEQNKCTSIGKLRPTDSTGRPVPAYYTENLTDIPQNHLFMWGPTSPKSLDSRYLGPIHTKEMKLVLLKPLWLFDTDPSKKSK